MLEDYPSQHFSEKRVFASRLAECLGPYNSTSIHKITLNIYQVLFRNYLVIIFIKNSN